MGLAYDLDTKSFPNPHFFAWDEVLTNGDQALFINTGIGGRGEDINIPSSFDDPADYSEFDVIIRSTTYANDFYIITGSYRAFFEKLNGGAGAWAWDGFITFVRAHNIGMVSAADLPIPTPESFANDQRKFWITPGVIDGLLLQQPFSSVENAYFTYLCRMPYEVEPDLTGLGSDSTPGVYAVDVAKFGTAGIDEIVIYAGGHQRIASTEGMTTSQNYSGWISKLHFLLEQPFIISTEASVPGGKETLQKYRGLSFIYTVSFTASWKGDTANHVGRYLPSKDLYPTAKNLEDVARGINTTTNPYPSFNFDKLTAIDNGYYISRIHDLVVTNGGPFPLIFADTSNSGNSATMCMSITGEAIADDGAGGVSFTTPFVSFWQPDENGPMGLNQCYTSLGNKNWGLDGSLPAYNLNGAYGTVIMPTFTESPDPFIVNVAIGIDNVTHGATTSAEIYVANWQYCLGCFDNNAPNFKPSKSETVFPFAVKGGGFETATGYTLPDKWLGKAVQQATYSRQDEAIAKQLDAYEAQLADPDRGTAPDLDYQSYADRELELLLQSDPTLGNLSPDPLNFLVPFKAPNYYQYGTSNKGEPPVGIPANVAYGFLGYSTGVGPVIFMYDFGTLYMTINNTNPPKFVLGLDNNPLLGEVPVLMISVGDSLNGAIDGGSSTTRRPVSARWDADRDQWIFTFADTTGGSLVSCNSAFDRQPPTQIAYLDQTDQFIGIDSDAKSSLYISRNMTPFLDGLVLFGGEVDTASKGQAAIKAITINAQLDPNGPAQPVTGFQPYIIQGTTGREARVWVDYLLFDGVDSMVAKELQSMGLRVTVENVEWYKAKILKSGKLGITPEEIEDWVRSQQTEYRETLKLKERQGRLRTRRRQQAAWREGLEDTLAGDFQETTGFDSLEALDKASETFVPDPSESAPISGNKSKKHSSIQKSNSDKKRDSDA